MFMQVAISSVGKNIRPGWAAMVVDWLPANVGASFKSDCRGVALDSLNASNPPWQQIQQRNCLPGPSRWLENGQRREGGTSDVRCVTGWGDGVLCMLTNWTERKKDRETLRKTPRSQLGGVGSQLLWSMAYGFGKGNCLRRLWLVAGPAGRPQAYSWTLQSWHSPLGRSQQEGMARDASASPEVLALPLSAFALARLVWWFSAGQLSLPCSWTQNLASVLGPKFLSWTLISPFKAAEDLALYPLSSVNRPWVVQALNLKRTVFSESSSSST